MDGVCHAVGVLLVISLPPPLPLSLHFAHGSRAAKCTPPPFCPGVSLPDLPLASGTSDMLRRSRILPSRVH